MRKYKIYTLEKGIVETDKYHVVKYLTWHRVDGPAFIKYSENYDMLFESYWLNGKRHRLNGPGYIKYDNNGNITFASYWINGIAYNKDQYDNELLKLKLNAL